MFLFSINDKNDDFSQRELSDICEGYYSDIYNYCVSRLDASCAGDITDDVFELFCKKWQKLENINYKAWLYEAARILIKNHYKKQKRQKKNETYIDDLADEKLVYEENFEIIHENISEGEIEAHKGEVIKSLSEQDQKLFDMKYTEKLSNALISEKLSINEKALEKRLYRLKQKIIIAVSDKLNQ